MTTARQQLGQLGEEIVAKHVACPGCDRRRSLKRLPTNFKCADLVCDFCGFLAQVKASTSTDPSSLPKIILGAAWSVQKERMDAGIRFPLFVVLWQAPRRYAVYFLAAEDQPDSLFVPRAPLSSTARRAGWQGFVYDLTQLPAGKFALVHSAG